MLSNLARAYLGTIDNAWYLEHWYLKVSSYIKEYYVGMFHSFLYISTPFISDYWYLKIIFWDQKIYFEISVVLGEI